MKKKTKGTLYCALLSLTAFALFTVATCLFDVKAIGPEGSKVGFATVNGFFHDLTGVHLWLYDLTDLLSILPLSAVLGFALLGLSQWIKRKSLLKVDADVLVLGGFYLSVLAVFLLFEKLSPNFRPVLLDGVLEPSYPSSTTMLVLCVLSTFALQMRARIKNRPLCSVTDATTETVLFADMPVKVVLAITYTEPGLKGDTATNTTKPATLETGAEIRVPLFINEGELVEVDTRNGDYVGRVKA